MILISFASAATWEAGLDAPTITDTLALASSGDTLLIEGEWRECVDTGGRSVTLSGSGTIDGTGCESTIRVVNYESVTVSGLTVTNTTGRAFDLQWSNLDLEGVTVSGSGATALSGGAIYTYGGTLTTTDCTFSDNTAWQGGAIYLYAYTTWFDEGSTFTDNTSASSGGAVLGYYDNAITLVGSAFTGNSAGEYGGAVSTWDYTDLRLDGVTFTGNATALGGGAVFAYAVDSTAGFLDVSGSTFADNSAADGGGIWVGWTNAVAIDASTFTSNSASATGGGLLAYVTGTTTLTDDQFCDNAAVTGGGVSVQWTTTDTWTNNRFIANRATYGGGSHRYASYDGSILQNTFVGNSAPDGAAYYASWGYADLRNNLVAASDGSGFYTPEAWTEASSIFTYDGWSGNTWDAAGYFGVDLADGHVRADDPGFVAYDGCDSDLRLTGASPFKDVGDPTVLDPDGSRSDIGAYGGPDAPVVDRDGDGFDTTLDCDDTSAARGPGATEVCDGADDDCDGIVDDDAGIAWYADDDSDGYGAEPTTACDAPDGYVAEGTDCDDADPWVHPGASDYPGDGLDADCDGADNTQVIPTRVEDGCGCASATAPGAWALGAALLAVRRRRRG